MAAVIIEEARAAREKSRQLRAHTFDLRLAVHLSTRAALVRREHHAATAESINRKRLALPVPSPWSDLEWRRADAELTTALVPVD